MPVYRPRPNFKITIGANSWENDKAISGKIIRVENGFDIGTLYFEDVNSRNFTDNVDADKSIQIDFKDASETSYYTALKGIIRFVSPQPITEQGEMLELTCDGAGWGLGETLCGEEYGTESRNPTIDTLQEIITDSNKGIVPKWVNKLLGTATDSGHSYTANTTTVENITGTIKYLYSPFKPCLKALQDLCDIVQAIKGSSAGPHWIVDTSDNVLVKTVDASHGDAANNKWYKYYGNSQANATLEQGKDFTDNGFNFQKLSKEANYVLYQGAFVFPSNTDKLTEGNSSLWGVETATPANTLSDDATTYKIGSQSLKFRINSSASGAIYYPSGQNAGWDVKKWGGKYNIPQVHFFARFDSISGVDGGSFRLYTSSGNFFSYYNWAISAEASTWYEFTFPIGENAQERTQDTQIRFASSGTPDWANINWIRFGFSGASSDTWLDGFYFAGTILRGARESTAFSSTNKLKTKIITDDIAKDDALKASDDSGSIARLAKAELLRSKGTPIVGWVQTPLIYDLLPGQFLHIHAKKKSDGTFTIDKDMRATRVIHTFPPFFTTIHLTDDLVNANARASWLDINTILKSARPEFQDRQASSIKAREIDVTQPILEVSY